MSGGNAARMGDEAKCEFDSHGGPCCPHQVEGRLVTGAPSVLIEGRPAGRLGDVGVAGPCCGTHGFKVAEGAEDVLIEGARAARQEDRTIHCGGASGKITTGASAVFVGKGG